MLRMVLLVLLLAAGSAAADPASMIDPYVEVLAGPSVPVSLFVAPGGLGLPFDEAVPYGGGRVDATLVVRLWTDAPGWGDPIAFFPREDLWLESYLHGLVPCAGGTIADSDTDAYGITSWSAPLQAGGMVDYDAGDRLLMMINGSVANGFADGLGMRINSADINGDLQVNLADVGLMSQDRVSAYRYRSDFVWDGVINLSDIGRMVQALGQECP
jgi:hypothetical protein